MLYILGIDQGTTGTTVALFNENGQLAQKEYREHKQYYPKKAWVEHDPLEIWQNTYSLIVEAVNHLGIVYKQIKSIGITNQRETTVLWNKKTGKPVYNAIVWQCGRTKEYCDGLKEKISNQSVQEKTGLLLNPYFSASKVNWILNHVKGLKEKVNNDEICFGTIDSWLIWNLSGAKDHITDFTNASRTLLFNIKNLEWDEELLKLFEIPKTILAEVKDSSGYLSKTDATLFDGNEILISGVAGDQQAALYGQQCWSYGDVKNTYGTGCFFMVNTADKMIISKHQLLSTLACDKNGKSVYALEGSVFMAGAIIQWLRDELKVIEKAEETEEIAESVTDNGGVYLVPSFVGLGAPYWRSDLKAALFGMSRASSKSHIVRASLEAIAYQVKDLIDLIETDLSSKITDLKVDGGATENNFLMQFQSDILKKNVDRPEVIETTVLGAVMLAANAIDFWSDDVIKYMRKTDQIFKPQPDLDKEEFYTKWKKYVNAVVNLGAL